jgi:hypothetical protein
MTIDGGIPRGWSGISGGFGTRPVQERHAANEVRSGTHQAVLADDEQTDRSIRLGRPLLLARVQESVLHHRELQNFHIAFPGIANPYAALPDSQLTTALKNNFAALEKLNKGGGLLTQAALRQIAAAKMGESERQDHTIQLANAILKRPRLKDAVLDRDGCVTRQSLIEASGALCGNSDPRAFSQDPFQAKSNAQVVQVFRGMFDELRDTSQDRTVLFEKYRYVKVDLLIAMSKDPDQTDSNGDPVLDQATGLPQKQYSEEHVYMAKNLVERRGLLRSLGSASANGSGLFGGHKEGWLNNKSLERWFENDNAQQAR